MIHALKCMLFCASWLLMLQRCSTLSGQCLALERLPV